MAKSYRNNYPTKLIEHVFPRDDEKNTFVRDKRLDSKIPANYWIAFRRQNGTEIEFRQEMLQR